MLSHKVGARLAEGLLLRDCLGFRRLVVSDCFHLHHLSFLDFVSLSLLFCFTLQFIVVVIINSIIKQLLPQPLSFLTFTLPILFPPSCWGGE